MAVIIKKYSQNWPAEWPFVWVSNVVMKPQHASCYVYNQEYVVWHVEDMLVASIAWKQFLFIVLTEKYLQWGAVLDFFHHPSTLTSAVTLPLSVKVPLHEAMHRKNTCMYPCFELNDFLLVKYFAMYNSVKKPNEACSWIIILLFTETNIWYLKFWKVAGKFMFPQFTMNKAAR